MEWRCLIASKRLPHCQQENGWSLPRDHPIAGCQLDIDNRNNVMVAVDNDDLIIDDEIEEATPFRMDFDQHWHDLNHTHRGGHDSANPDREVDVVNPRCVTALQHGFAYPGLLLRRQSHAR